MVFNSACSSRWFPFSLAVVFLGFPLARSAAADQPQWGQAWSRNMISLEKGLPDSFDPKSGKNLKWTATLGTQTFSTPVIAGGRVYIGTNNEEPRDPSHHADSGVLMCFDEKSGKFLWQLVVPKREDDPYCDWPKTGMSSPVTVEGDHVYLVSNRGEVMCLDARGMANGNDGPFKEEAAHMVPRILGGEATRATNSSANRSLPTPAPGKIETSATDADILWLFDLTTGAGIWSHDGAHSSILIDEDFLYLNTGTGVDNTHKVIRTPNAPSLIVLDKRTGRYLARDDEHMAPDIFHCTWSSPSMGKVGGRKLIFFAGGNGIIYAFEPVDKNILHAAPNSSPTRSAGLQPAWDRRARQSRLQTGAPTTLKKVWQFDFDPTAPKEDIHKYLSNRREGPSNFYGMPVFDHDRIFIAGGGDVFWGKNEAWLKCIDATKTGDITTNGLVWSYPLEKHVLGTPAIFGDCVFIADNARTMHCVNAKTGQPNWTQEIQGEVWASPLAADGKVYLGARNGDFWIFEASKEKRVLGKIQLGAPINSTVTAANGAIYFATMNQLFAIRKSK